MNGKEIVFHSIGTIRSPHGKLSEIPIQPVFAEGIEGQVIVHEEYVEGLSDLEGFSHIYLFYHFHRSEKSPMYVKPYLSNEKRGIFATRAPHRPNKLGMSLVRLDRIEKNTLYVKDIDILDGTTLLDIKPYIERFDYRNEVRSGWQDDISDSKASKEGLRNYKEH